MEASSFSNYTQNIVCLEHLLPDLVAKNQYASMVRLTKPDAGNVICLERSHTRIVKGGRVLSIGRLRSDVLCTASLIQKILETADDGLRFCPDLALIVGTKLGIPGFRSIATNFCRPARSAGGASL